MNNIFYELPIYFCGKEKGENFPVLVELNSPIIRTGQKITYGSLFYLATDMISLEERLHAFFLFGKEYYIPERKITGKQFYEEQIHSLEKYLPSEELLFVKKKLREQLSPSFNRELTIPEQKFIGLSNSELIELSYYYRKIGKISINDPRNSTYLSSLN